MNISTHRSCCSVAAEIDESLAFLDPLWCHKRHWRLPLRSAAAASARCSPQPAFVLPPSNHVRETTKSQFQRLPVTETETFFFFRETVNRGLSIYVKCTGFFEIFAVFFFNRWLIMWNCFSGDGDEKKKRPENVQDVGPLNESRCFCFSAERWKGKQKHQN